MENPIDFDIWCKIKDGAVKAAAVWTGSMHSITIVDAFKIVRESLDKDNYIQIFMSCGWDDIPRLLQELPDFVQEDSCVVTESSYRPSVCIGYCKQHFLLHISQSCPICTGFYISRVVDGKRIVSNFN